MESRLADGDLVNLLPFVQNSAFEWSAAETQTSMVDFTNRARRWTALLHAEVEECAAPDVFWDLLHDAPTTPAVIVSNLVVARCEALAVAEQLVYGVLRAVTDEDVILACLAARALVETAAELYRRQDMLEIAFDAANTAGVLREECSSRGSALARELLELRYGARDGTTRLGAPLRKNVLGAVDRIGPEFRNVYDQLSEVCHPNSQQRATFWRQGHKENGGLVVPFIPSGGESPVKVTLLNAVRLGAMTAYPFARTAWWMASIISLETGAWKSDRGSRFGFPAPKGRNDPCVCGSGIKSKRCDHPDPQLPDVD